MSFAQPADADAVDPVEPVERVADSVLDVLRSFLEQVPLILLALVVFGLFWLAGGAVRNVVRRLLLREKGRSESFAKVLAKLSRFAVLLVGALVALSIAVPSVNLATVVGALGITTVAIGFAFQDILQNILAGLLILFRRPFVEGDQIHVVEHEGTVEGVTIRETRVRRYDGRVVLIPNKDVYMNAVTVQTAGNEVRSSLLVGVDYGTDLGRAREIATAALGKVEGVLADPAPEAYYVEFGTSTVNLDLRYWTRPRQHEIRAVQDRVVAAVVDAFNGEGIAMPADIVELVARPSLSKALERRT